MIYNDNSPETTCSLTPANHNGIPETACCREPVPAQSFLHTGSFFLSFFLFISGLPLQKSWFDGRQQRVRQSSYKGCDGRQQCCWRPPHNDFWHVFINTNCNYTARISEKTENRNGIMNISLSLLTTINIVFTNNNNDVWPLKYYLTRTRI